MYPTSGPVSGSLTVTIKSAAGIKDTNTIGKQDPYCKVTLLKEKFKTKTHDNGGTAPVWNQSFIMNVNTKDIRKDIVKFELWDKEAVSDDFIGRADVFLMEAIKMNGPQNVPVKDKSQKKTQGSLDVTFKWVQSSPELKQQAPQVQQQQQQYVQQPVQQQPVQQQYVQQPVQQQYNQQPVQQQYVQQPVQQQQYRPQVVVQPRVIVQPQRHHPHQSATQIAPFVNGRSVILTSCASGRSLRVMQNGIVNGTGGQGKLARFVVCPGRSSQEIRLRAHNGRYLRITQAGALDAAGGLGPWTAFAVKRVGQNVALMSAQHGRYHIGVLPNGHSKPPSQTGTGLHGLFSVRLV